MIHYFPDLRRDEVQAFQPELTVFLFPMGGLEQHGSHLPIGTKWRIAEAHTRLLVESLQSKMPQWNFILMPSVPMTVDAVTSRFALPVRAHVVRDYLVDQCRALKRLGFTKFAVYSAHLTPRQLSAIEEASKIVSRRGFLGMEKKAVMVSVTSPEVTSGEVLRSPMIPNPKEHAGAQDTAAMLLIKKDLVSKDYLSLPDLPSQKESVGRLISYIRHQLDGTWGKPKEANPVHYESQLKERLDKTAVMLQAVFETGQGTGLFNSGYRYFFFNGSFFAAYLLGGMFFILMMVWTLWSLKDVFEQ